MATIHLAINGHPYTVDADPQTSLLTVLREHLDLTGTKYGCGEGSVWRLHRLDRWKSPAVVRHESRERCPKANHHH